MKMKMNFSSMKTAIQVANLKINPRIRIQYKQLIFYVFIRNDIEKVVPNQIQILYFSLTIKNKKPFNEDFLLLPTQFFIRRLCF